MAAISAPPRAPVKGDAALAGGLFAAFVLVYLGTAKGILEEVDDAAMLRVTESIVRYRSVSVPADTPGSAPGRAGQSYPRYGLGQSLLGIPFFIVGSALPSDVPTRDVYDPHGFVLATPLAFAMTGLGAVSGAAATALLFLTARALRLSSAASLWAALCLGLGTFTWFYARTFMSETPSMVCALLAFYGLLRFADNTSSRRWLFTSGCAAGMLLLLRLGNAALLPPLGLWLLWILCSTSDMRHARVVSLSAIATWLAPVGAALAIIGAYNQVRFGSPLDTGYTDTSQSFTTPILLGLYGLLLSPGKSVFLYAPIAVAGVLGWFTLRRAFPQVAWSVAALVLAYVVFYAHYDWWYGGGPWAARFLTVILPFVCLPIAALLARPLPRAALVSLAALAVLSVVIQLLSILIPYLPYDAMMEQDPVEFERLLWHPAYSPIVAAARALVRRTYPLDLAFSYFAIPWLPAVQAAATLAGATLLAACIHAASRSGVDGQHAMLPARPCSTCQASCADRSAR